MKKRGGSRLLALMAAGALLVWFNSRGWTRPLKVLADYTVFPIGRGFVAVGSGVGNFFHTASDIHNLTSQNAKLEHEVATLRQKLSEDAELRVQNDTLRRQLGFNQSIAGRLIPAAVVAYQPDNFRQYLTLGRGSNAGIKEGMAVVTEGALVGRVSEVSAATSKVALVSDPNFRINGLDQETRASGTVHGQIGAGLVMDKIAQSDIVKTGDTVITSGLGGELPKGIIIGQVQAINVNNNDVFQTALVAPAAKLAHLELVFVVIGQ